MSTPRIKRPFAGAAADPSQRQITSFFNQGVSGASASTAGPVRQPLLPSSVQSNLLSVGMRIRKSVPEGYKTAAPSAFTLWTDTTPPKSAAQTPSRGACAQRELLPFCGINSVGGLDSQPAFRIDEDDEDIPALDAVPELTLSQESAVSTESSEPSRKRILDEEDVDERPVLAWDGEVSPRSLAPMGWRNGRVMAIPRSRAKKTTGLKDLGQENMAMDGDFEDADFLVYEGMDMTS